MSKDIDWQEFDASGLSAKKIAKVLGVQESTVHAQLRLRRGYTENKGRAHVGEKRVSYTISFPGYVGRAIEEAALEAKLPPKLWLKRYVMEQMGFGARPVERQAPAWIQDHAQRIEEEDAIRWHIYRNAALRLIGLPEWDGARVDLFGMGRQESRRAMLSWSAYWDAVTGELCQGHTNDVLFAHFCNAFQRVNV